MPRIRYTTTVILGTIICSTLTSVSGFIPDSLAGIASPTSTFHTVMTKKALMRHAVDFFNDFRQPWELPLQQQLAGDESPKKLFAAFYNDRSVDEGPFVKIIESVQNACGDVDHNDNTKSNPKWHFDAEQIEQGRANLVEYIYRITDDIHNNQFDLARKRLGNIFHPLQDFYSHTNWIEMGHQGIMRELLDPNEVMPVFLASPKERTCYNCTKNFSEKVLSALLKLSTASIGIRTLGGDEDNIFECNDNLDPAAYLTSGYYTNQRDDDGNLVEKPHGVGKCSHGGALDRTSALFATGGINKDMRNSIFSPHDYLHDEATRLAEEASVHLLTTLRKKVDDDTKWAQFLQLVPGPSMAFAVDVCPSMLHYLDSVKETIREAIAANSANDLLDLRRQFIIVPFNDHSTGAPEIGTTPEDLDQIFKRAIDFYEGDCKTTRKLYQAIQKASLKSHVGGYVYATTDGIPSDYYLEPWVSSTLRSKQLSFRMILANTLNPGPLPDPSKSIRRAVHRDYTADFAGIGAMADGNNGEFRIASEQRLGSKPLFQMNQEFMTDLNLLMIASDVANRSFRFPVDSSVKVLVVSITSTANFLPQIYLQDPSGTKFDTRYMNIIDDVFHNTVTVEIPDSGSWLVTVEKNFSMKIPYTVKIQAQSSLRVMVKMLSDDSETQGPKKGTVALHPGLQDIGERRPLIETRLVLELTAESTLNNATPVHFQFRDRASNLLGQYKVERSKMKGKAYYASFEVPLKPFYVRVFGMDQNGNKFVRTDPRLFTPTTLDIKLLTQHPLPVPGSPFLYRLPFSVRNIDSPILFTVKVYDTSDIITSSEPKASLLSYKASFTGMINFDGRKFVPEHRNITQVAIIVAGVEAINSNSLTVDLDFNDIPTNLTP